MVIFGAGLDTRAYRLAWPDDTTLHELDLAPVFALKQAAVGADAVEHSGFSLDAQQMSSVREVGVDKLEQLIAGAKRGAAALTDAGWQIVEQYRIPDLAREYGRRVPPLYGDGSDRVERARLLMACPGPA